MVKVTVNGQPVEEVVKQEAADEILQVRESENKIRLPRSGATKHNGNHSGARTSAGVALYPGDPKATHVLCAGSLWPISEKRPFEKCGFSCYGAVEFCEATQEFKCHECGEWHSNLGRHATHRHVPRFWEYKKKVGISVQRGISSPATKSLRKAKMPASLIASTKKRISSGALQKQLVKSYSPTVRASVYSGRTNGRVMAERMNILGLCRAQMIRDFKQLYLDLNRTPTAAEMASYINATGVHSLAPVRIQSVFCSRKAFFIAANVPQRRSGAPDGANSKWWSAMGPQQKADRIKLLAQARTLYHKKAGHVVSA